jgi:uncharacterized protein (DUF362 family)
MSRFVDGKAIKSKVAITTAKTYDDAEKAVEKAIQLLGGAETICSATDVVMIKPNIVLGNDPDLAETTHPAVIAALVKILKTTGATIKIGEQSAWNFDTDEAFDGSGIRKAVLEAGADEIVPWDQGERVDVKIPGARSHSVISMPKSVMDADVFIHVPKMKTNFVQTASLALKGLIGVLTQKDRGLHHRTHGDVGWAVSDVAKAIGSRHRLTLMDGITAMEGGGPHAGLKCNPGVIVASPDMVAVNAVTSAIMGLHPLELAATQVAMKDGLGTGELSEMEILGKTIAEVLHPFKRPVVRWVTKYQNVREYVGGTCDGCVYGFARSPLVVDPKKTYALIAGARVCLPDDLQADEVWLIGECACLESHQFPGYMEKLKNCKTVHKFGRCPGILGFHNIENSKLAKGTPYEVPHQCTLDACTLVTMPDLVRKEVREAAEARREGRMTLDEFKKQEGLS